MTEAEENTVVAYHTAIRSVALLSFLSAEQLKQIELRLLKSAEKHAPADKMALILLAQICEVYENDAHS